MEGLAAALDTGPHRRLEAALQAIDARAGLFLGGHHHFGGSRWRWRAEVRDEVGDRDVDLVSDRGNDRHRGRRDRPRQDLLVERPEILDRSAAASDDHHVDARDARDRLERTGDVLARAVALHAHRPHDQVRIGMPAAQDLDDVLERRAVERGDDANLAGEGGNRALARRGEEPLGLQLSLQLLERELQRAAALRLEMLADELIFALRFIDRQPARARPRECRRRS